MDDGRCRQSNDYERAGGARANWIETDDGAINFFE
jgi:hypothetical protein